MTIIRRADGRIMRRQCIDIPEDDFKKLRHLAVDMDISVAALVRSLIRARVEHLS